MTDRYPPVSFMIGKLIGASLVGLFCGLIPLVVGSLLNQKRLGTGGFLACVVGGLLGGLFLTVPLALVFSVKKRYYRREGPQGFEKDR